MIARMDSGWQTVLADLSLILFMVTASALGEVENRPPPAAPQKPVLPALGEPVALWRQAPGSPSLTEWLARANDPRLRLTIMAAPEQAQAALDLAAGAGRPARILIEPGSDGVVAALTFDQALARGLQIPKPPIAPTRETRP